MGVRLLRGRAVLHELGGSLDELQAAVGAPVTARRPWLQTWVDCYTDYTPTVVVVDGPGGRLDGAALLASRRRVGVHDVVALGHGPSDAITFPARESTSARTLAAAVGRALHAQRGSWTLRLRHLAPEDLVAEPLADALGRSSLAPGDVLPAMRADAGRSLRSYVSRNHHQQVQRLRNRIRREGLDVVVDHLHRRSDIAAVMPEVERVLRARDADVGRRCALDDPAAGPFLRRVIDVHAAAGDVRLTTLRLDGRLAAYVLCFEDRGTFRMWSCRFDPGAARFGVGKIAMDESVQHALDHGAEAYDFMRGEEQYKDSYANEWVRARDLRAWSGPVLAARGSAGLVAREQVARLEARGGRGARVAEVARRVAARGSAR